MKLTTIILITLGIQVSSASFAQRVTISRQNSTLKTILQDLRKQTGYYFMFNNEVIKNSRSLSLDLKNVTLNEALTEIFKYQPLTYSIEKNIIVVKQRIENLQSGAVAAKVITIEGRVTDDKNLPLPGVTIVVREGKAVAITNSDGFYKIKAEENHTLLFSYLGFKREEVPINKRTQINVIMTVSSNELNEMVVVGYGSQQKKLVTGAIGVVKGEELAQSPAVNLSNTLMGRVTGLSTSPSSSGAPDRDRSTIKIRGLGEALIVIDGVAREGMGILGMEIDKLDPNSIETISVLKDASAAVYGARGANGVVLITTKRGKTNGKVSLNYSGNYGFQQSTQLPKFLDSYNYALLNNEMFDNDKAEKGSSTRTKYTEEEIQKFKDGSDPDRYPNTNWYKEVLKSSAVAIKHNLSLTGGGTNSRYFLSGTYTGQDGLISTSGMKRYGIVSNVDLDVSPTTLVSVGLNYVTETGKNPASFGEGVFSRMAVLGSVAPARFSNGLYAYSGFSGNPLADALEGSGYNKAYRNIFTGSLKLTQQIPFVKGLSATGLVTVDRNNGKTKAFTVPFPVYSLNALKDEYKLENGTERASLSENISQNNNVNIQVSMNYKRLFGKHSISALALYEQNELKGETITAERSNFPISSVDQLFLGDPNSQKSSGNAMESARQSAVARLVYNYNSRYIVESNFRYDGSPFYPKGKRRALFPSLAVAWILSEENFIKDNYPFIDELKIRSSYGKLGNDGGALYSYFYNYTLLPVGYVFGTNNALAPMARISNSSVPNTNITWEKVNSFDIGIDATLWKGLLGVEVDYYNKYKYDILRNKGYDVPSTFGLLAPLENFGKERYYGFEFALSHRNKIGQVSYSARLNMTFTKSKVIDYGENENMLPGLRQEGLPVGTARILKADGIFRDQQDVDSWPKYLISPGGTPVSGKPGDIRYSDLNGDGVVELYAGSPDRNVLTKYIVPPTIYGLSLGFKWKNFAADAFFQASTGVYINYAPAADLTNFYQLHLDRWTPGRQDASYPRLLSNYEANRYPSTFYVKNGNYLKLRTAQLSYTLPQELLKKVGISSLTLTGQGQNLFTITSNKRFDPESSGTFANSYPPQRIFSFGLRLGL
ncbi:TonB-linked outer membrane protein, SusC/RagA family [Pedobacter caeni]|uniref:TonB-linked outer membrane protein, SusC/RagA family n=2 Tax=Pedobacter caeni TaxID=288992 RepID=A0A1M4X3Y5_9SPHI|nr:TonB-linked outer membrane protein, SusC/RagA family [Pedobacter caeni]